jgi:hypothetical protein
MSMRKTVDLLCPGGTLQVNPVDRDDGATGVMSVEPDVRTHSS